MRFLVTGGAGFIGSNLVRELVRQEHDVRILDDLSTGRMELIGDLVAELSPEHVDFVQGSVEDVGLVNAAMVGVDLVIHAAARNIASSVAQPHEGARVNVIGTLNVLLAAREAGVKRVVYCSSASVYGPCLSASEHHAGVILSPYAASKAAAEHYCEAFAKCYGLDVLVARYSNVYGPGQSAKNPQCGVVARFLAQALRGEPITVIGDGRQTRDFTYVSDVVDATLRLAFAVRPEGPYMPSCDVFNVGSGLELSINDLAAAVRKICDNASPLEHGLAERPIDNIDMRSVSAEKIRTQLGWAPRIGLIEGLYLTRQWLAAHG